MQKRPSRSPAIPKRGRESVMGRREGFERGEEEARVPWSNWFLERTVGGAVLVGWQTQGMGRLRYM